MSSIPISTERPEAPLFSGGLGERVVAADGATGELLQILRIRPALTAIPSFEFALRERTARLANFRHAYYARVRRVDRVQAPAPGLAIVSDHVEGTRLADLLRIAHERSLQLDVNAALCLIRQLVPAVALLHENARDVAHGLIAPERLIVTPHARLVIVEHVLAAAIEQLQWGRDRLWQEFRIAMPPSAGLSRFDHRADVTGVGLVALALLLGRPLEAGEYPQRLPALLQEARERTALGEERPLSPPLRDWLTRALQMDTRRAFASAPEALNALEDLVAEDSSYVPAPVALETFLSRYIAALLEPAPGEATAPPSASTREVTAPARPGPSADPAPPAAPPPPGSPDRLSARPAAAARPGPQAPVPAPAPSLPAPVEPLRLASARRPSGEHAPAAGSETVAALPDITDLIPVDDLAVPKGTEAARPSLFGPDGPFGGAEEEEAPVRASRGGGRWKKAALAVAALVILGAAGIVAPKFLTPLDNATSPQMGTLVVQSNPAGVEVVVDGVERGLTPATISVTPGAHILELRGRGVPRVIPFNATAGAQVSHHIEFANTPETGQLRVETTPEGAKVTVDGVERGVSPLTVTDLTPGDHEVVLDTAEASSRHVVTVQAGGTASLVAPVGAAAPASGPVSGWIRVRAPFTMEIREGGRVVGTTDADRIMLAAGRHELEFVNDALGYSATRVVTVQAGRVSTLNAELPSGTVNLNASPWAEVFIDGQRVGETPIGNLAVPIGPHEIIFRHPQFGEKRHAISVTLTAPVRLSVDMR